MATLAQIRTAVDNRLTALWPTMQTRQATYLANHGRYWQGLRTHSVNPAEGNTVLPTVGTAVPYYQTAADAWPSAILTTALEMVLWMDQYVTPDGTPGYVGTVQVDVLGHTYQRSQQVGPETWRTDAWHESVRTP